LRRRRLRRRRPRDEAELFGAAHAFAGWSLAELARALGVEVPPDVRRAKGFAGRLLERALRAERGSRAGPDFVFPAGGVELKTLPVDARGRPLESTFVCSASLAEIAPWPESKVRAKLARVLWIPIERGVELAESRVGSPLLWSPSAAEEQALAADYEAHAELIALGYTASISGHRGRFLQLRPKSKLGAARRPDPEGGLVLGPRRAFYLRASFTARIIARHYIVPPAGEP